MAYTKAKQRRPSTQDLTSDVHVRFLPHSLASRAVLAGYRSAWRVDVPQPDFLEVLSVCRVGSLP